VIPDAPSGRRKDLAGSEIASACGGVALANHCPRRPNQEAAHLSDEGVPEYWIIDLDARAFERWRPNDERPEILADTLVWQPRADIEPLTIDLEEYFTGVLD